MMNGQVCKKKIYCYDCRKSFFKVDAYHCGHNVSIPFDSLLKLCGWTWREGEVEFGNPDGRITPCCPACTQKRIIKEEKKDAKTNTD